MPAFLLQGCVFLFSPILHSYTSYTCRTEPDANAPTEQGRKSPLPGGWKPVRLRKTGWMVAGRFCRDCVFCLWVPRKLL